MKRMLHGWDRSGAVPDAVHEESKMRHSREHRPETLPEGLRRDFPGLGTWTVGSGWAMKMCFAWSWKLTVVERETAELAATETGWMVSSAPGSSKTHQSHSHSSTEKTEELAVTDDVPMT